MTAKSHPAAMRFIPEQLQRELASNNHISSSDLMDREPARYSSLQILMKLFCVPIVSEWLPALLDV
jgi:hypothetical protein